MQYLDYNECKQRGTFDFPIEFYYMDSQHPRYTMPYHWHVEYEIIHIIEGSFVLSIDEVEYRGEKGDFFFICSGSLHGGIPKDCIYECIVFDMKMLIKHNNICQTFIDAIMNHSIQIHKDFPNDNSEMNQTVKNLFHAMNHKYFGYQLVVQGSLYQLLGIMIKNKYYTMEHLQSPQNYIRIDKLKQVLGFIENNYSNTITLEQLSKIAGMTPKYFCRYFKEMTHKSPIDYLNYYRIERACYQLANTDSNIITIAYNCGFNDLSYFIKTFKRYKGETPKKFLKVLQNLTT